jgi:uncharacterized protein (TIGR03435 family)
MFTLLWKRAEYNGLPAVLRPRWHIVGLITWVLLSGAVVGTCEPGARETGFEVASIKPAAARSQMEVVFRNLLWEDDHYIPIHGRNVELMSITLRQLIALAYQVDTYRVSGWKGEDTEERFDIRALLPEGVSFDREMLKRMLADRFALRAHVERRETDGFLLVVSTRGPHLKPADPAAANAGRDAASLLARKREAQPRGGRQFSSSTCSMAKLIWFLSSNLRVPIEDRTGLKGEYDVVLTIAPSDDLQTQSLDLPARIIAAVRVLGLDLKRGKVTVDQVLVDSVSKMPSEN